MILSTKKLRPDRCDVDIVSYDTGLKITSVVHQFRLFEPSS